MQVYQEFELGIISKNFIKDSGLVKQGVPYSSRFFFIVTFNFVIAHLYYRK